MDQAGELLQPRPLKLEEDGATLLVVSSHLDLLSGTRTRVLLWEGDLTTVGPVCGEPNLSQGCLDLQEVSCTECDPALSRDVSALEPGGQAVLTAGQASLSLS